MVNTATTVLSEVRRAVTESGLTLDQIAAGAKLGKSWLSNLMADKQGDYGIRRIDRLQAFLQQQKAA